MGTKQLITAGRECGGQVVKCIVAIGLICFALGWSVENSDVIFRAVDAVWNAALFAVSFGGNFWPAVALGTSMIAVVLWAFCVGDKLPEAEYKQNALVLFSIGISASIIWLLTFCAMHQTFTELKSLSPYAVIAVIVMTLPIIGGVLAVLGGLMMVAESAS